MHGAQRGAKVLLLLSLSLSWKVGSWLLIHCLHALALEEERDACNSNKGTSLKKAYPLQCTYSVYSVLRHLPPILTDEGARDDKLRGLVEKIERMCVVMSSRLGGGLLLPLSRGCGVVHLLLLTLCLLLMRHWRKVGSSGVRQTHVYEAAGLLHRLEA